MRRFKSYLLAIVLFVVFTEGSPLFSQETAQKASTDPSVTEQDKSAKSKKVSTLSPEGEKKLKDVLDGMRAEKAKIWGDLVESDIEDLVKLTGIGKDKSEALEVGVKPIIEKALDSWTGEAENQLRKLLDKLGSTDGAILDWYSGVAQFISHPAPDDTDDWVNLVHANLSSDQATLWDKDRETKKADMEKQLSQIIDPAVKDLLETKTKSATALCTEIEAELSMNSDGKAKLDALGKAAASDSAAAWKKKLEVMIQSIKPSNRAHFLQNILGGQTIASLLLDASFSEQSSWHDGLAGLLTDAEKAKLKDIADARMVKRCKIMGKLFVMLIDEKVALTVTQRDQLEPLAERLVRDITALYPDLEADYQGAPVDVFYSAAEKATDADLKPILDETQINRWRKLVKTPEKTPEDIPALKPGEAREPEYVEESISHTFCKSEKSEREKVLEQYTLKAEDVIRKIGVSPESATRLQLAARGTAEMKLSAWRYQTEQQIRAQLQNVNPENIDQRIASIQYYFFQFNQEPQTDLDTIWEKALKSELTPPQQDAWQKEIDSRLVFHNEAITDLVISDFSHILYLSDDQVNKLQLLLKGVVSDFSPDIQRIFGDSRGWYLFNGYQMMPMAGIPDDKLKTILSTTQMTAWMARPEYATCNNFWESIKQIHDQRMQQLKSQANGK